MSRNKFERVHLPSHFNLNGEHSVLVKTMQKLKSHEFVKNRSEFSVRTFYKDDRHKTAPHLCTTTKRSLFRKAPKMFRDGLWLIVADQVDAKDCEFRGTIWVQGTGKIIVEIALGPGTVRTVTNDGAIDESYDIKSYRHGFHTTGRLNLDHCITQCKDTNLKNVIFEFSYYKIPIGWKNERFICWEITDDGTKMCRLFKE